MNIKMTKKGNAKWNGVKYKAEPSDGRCAGCAFYNEPRDCFRVHCTSATRISPDYAHRAVAVIFVKKDKNNATNP